MIAINLKFYYPRYNRYISNKPKKLHFYIAVIEIARLEASLQDRPAALRIYTYMHKIASTGAGFYFDDIPTDTIEAPYLPDADFIIGVSGNSMEPTFSDGDLVYVHKCQIIETGVRSAVAMIPVLRFMIAGHFVSMISVYFPLNAVRLLRELSLNPLNFPLFYVTI